MTKTKYSIDLDTSEIVHLYKEWDGIGYYPAVLHFLWLLGGLDY